MLGKKDLVKEMIATFPGGKSALAGALGISEVTFNNKLYEKNGCRFFDVDELEAMQDLTKTNLVASYFAEKAGCIVITKTRAEELDNIDLLHRKLNTLAKLGAVEQVVALAIADGEIDPTEEKEIRQKETEFQTARAEEIHTIITVHKR